MPHLSIIPSIIGAGVIATGVEDQLDICEVQAALAERGLRLRLVPGVHQLM
jgi:hypothetical protein